MNNNDKKSSVKVNEYDIVKELQKENAMPENPENKTWLDEEDYGGQLAVDVYQSEGEIVIKSTIAGVRPEDIDISVNNDMITVRGKRAKDHEVKEEDYFYRECYWGGFSRSIILPCEVKVDKIRATMKNGVLTVVLPKASKASKVTVVKVKEE
ncbi:MAG: Hsp20/alpha crystallin family protein [Patescibacteria group bacterium]|jgi:HSP20 family protein